MANRKTMTRQTLIGEKGIELITRRGRPRQRHGSRRRAARPRACPPPPGRIQVIRYPDLDLARHYPTIGPPAAGATTATSAADVNGLAGSIELYLGRDVVTGPDGSLRPVQWTSLIAGMGRYQGEVTGKNDIHKAFRAKAAAASRDAAVISGQDWDGLRLILDAVFTAFA